MPGIKVWMAGTEEITFVTGFTAAATVQTSPLEGRADVVFFPRFRTTAAAASVMRVPPASVNKIRHGK